MASATRHPWEAAADSLSVEGVLVAMSGGLYAPCIQVRDAQTMKTALCDYRSSLAMRAGLVNPRHWAHAVYRTLVRLCGEHQAELQGGSMDAYHETAADREEAREARRRGYGE